MKRRFVTISGFVLGMASTLWAQQPTPMPHPLPDGPLLARAPEFAQWVVTVRALMPAPSTGQGPAAASLVVAPAPAAPAVPASPGQPAADAVRAKMIMTKTRDLIHAEMQYPGGRVAQMWLVKGIQATLVPGSKQWSVIAGGGMFHADYSQTEFPFFEWISPKTYVDVMKVMGRDCLVFKSGKASAETSGQPPQEGGAIPTDLGTKVACVDLETRLPVSIKRGNELRVYEFRPAPTEMQTPPADLLAMLEARQKSIQQNNAHPARP